MKKQLTKMQMSALKEALNIGSGHAALALSQLIDKKIMMAVVRSELMPSADFLNNVIQDKHKPVLAVYLQILGEAHGAVIFMFERESALKLIDLLRGNKVGHTKFIDETSESIIKELGSILTGSFLTVISDMMRIRFFHNIPYFASDTAEAVMMGVCEKIFKDRKKRLCLATEFIEFQHKITGVFAYVPTEKALDLMLERIKERKLCKAK